MSKCVKISMIILLTFLGFYGLVFTGIGAFFMYTMDNAKGNCQPWDKVKYVHKSNTAEYQENTLEAVLATIPLNMGSEFDIHQVATGEMILFHDDNALDVTGVDLDINSATIDQIKQLRYLNTVHNKTYSTNPSIPELKDVLEQLCTQDPHHYIDFDLKFVPNDTNTKTFFDIVDSSPCACDSSQKFIFATPYFYAISYLKTALETSRCHGQISLWFYPNIYPLGEYFWIKTRGSIYIGAPDSVNLYDSIVASNPELLDGLNRDGYCTAVYGNYYDKLKNYNYTDYVVVDVSNASLDDVKYTSQKSIYDLLIALFVLAVFSLAAFIIIISYICCFRKKEKDEDGIINEK